MKPTETDILQVTEPAPPVDPHQDLKARRQAGRARQALMASLTYPPRSVRRAVGRLKKAGRRGAKARALIRREEARRGHSYAGQRKEP